jgi:transcription termination factor NusB
MPIRVRIAQAVQLSKHYSLDDSKPFINTVF